MHSGYPKQQITMAAVLKIDCEDISTLSTSLVQQPSTHLQYYHIKILRGLLRERS
jgi:hypothetical protein